MITDSWNETNSIIQAALTEQEAIINASADTVDDVAESIARDIAVALDVSDIKRIKDLERELHVIGSPARTDPISTGPIINNISLEFDTAITEFDAKKHAEEIMKELRNIQEEERRQRFSAR